MAARENLRREVLPPEPAESRIKPVTIDWNLARETVVFSGVVPQLSINMEQIKHESVEHYRIIYELLILLNDQALVAWNAVAVAAENLAAVKRLADQLPDAIAARKENAKTERLKAMAGIGLLQGEADRLRKLDPDKPTTEVRAELLRFPGANVRMVRAVKIARRHKNLPRP